MIFIGVCLIYIYIYAYIGMKQICKYTWKWRQIWKCANYVANGSLLRLVSFIHKLQTRVGLPRSLGRTFSLWTNSLCFWAGSHLIDVQNPAPVEMSKKLSLLGYLDNKYDHTLTPGLEPKLLMILDTIFSGPWYTWWNRDSNLFESSPFWSVRNHRNHRFRDQLWRSMRASSVLELLLWNHPLKDVFDPTNTFTADVEVVRFYSHFLGAAMSKTKQVSRHQLGTLPWGWRCWDGIKSGHVEIRKSDTKMVKQVCFEDSCHVVTVLPRSMKFLWFSINQLAKPWLSS